MVKYGFWPDLFEKKGQSSDLTVNIEICVDVDMLGSSSTKEAAYFPVEIMPAHDDYMNESQKREYAKLIGGVLSIIDSLSFGIDEYHQNEGTYSYYIQFTPCDWSGEPFDRLVSVRFRVSDHDSFGDCDYSYNDSRGTLFKNFQLDGEQYSSIDELLDEVRSALQRIKEGDF